MALGNKAINIPARQVKYFCGLKHLFSCVRLTVVYLDGVVRGATVLSYVCTSIVCVCVRVCVWMAR